MKLMVTVAAFAVVFPGLVAGAMGIAGGTGAAQPTTESVASSAATTASPAVRELQAVEDKWTAAYNQRDQYGLELVLAPLFLDISPAGNFSTRDQQIANLITMDDKTEAAEQQVLAARVLGDVAIATGTYTYRHRQGNGEALDKGVFTHVFQRQHGQWMCVSAQETPVVSQVPVTKAQAKTKTRSQAEMPFHIPFFTKGNSQ